MDKLWALSSLQESARVWRAPLFQVSFHIEALGLGQREITTWELQCHFLALGRLRTEVVGKSCRRGHHSEEGHGYAYHVCLLDRKERKERKGLPQQKRATNHFAQQHHDGGKSLGHRRG